MDAKVTPHRTAYGVTWFLDVKIDNQTKRFYLGQDAKVCLRLLGRRPVEVADQLEEAVGSRNFGDEEVQIHMAHILLDEMYLGAGDEEITKDLKNRDTWDFAVE